MAPKTTVGDKRTSESHSEHPTPSGDAWNISLSALVDAYPNNMILSCIVVPTALHMWWTLIGILGLLFTHYRVCCEYWSTYRVCSSRTHYLLFAIESVLVALMGYTYYLKKMLQQEQQHDRHHQPPAGT